MMEKQKLWKKGRLGLKQLELTYYMKEKNPKKTYSQEDWPLYEKSCAMEKLMAYRIKKDVADFLEIPTYYKGNGRPPVNLRDIIKALCIKVYGNWSSWRLESELKIARAMGTIDFVYKRSTLNKYMASPIITEWLHKMYKLIASPLASIEVSFSADATGISTFDKSRWIEVREKKVKWADYKKLQIISGNKTNVICKAEITSGTTNECPRFIKLLDETAKIFNVKEICADAGYLARYNVDFCQEIGAEPYIMPKKNTAIKGISGATKSWGKMIKLWRDHRDIFAQHYHQRSNIESTFGALKRKFGFYVRSKCEIAQENEILIKIICYNCAVLNEALLTFRITPEFMASL